MFVDEVIVTASAGDGGNGCMAFRREKYIPMGGPFGGSGGKGGDIIFESDPGLKTLLDFRYKKHIKAPCGISGTGKNKNGKDADDTIIKVPLGTIVRDNKTSNIIADLVKPGQRAIIAHGGKGGRGNVSLATRSNPCPSYCENGDKGEEIVLKIELKMLADVGLVGLPSVGKSTLLSSITNANPKIAPYHFTTINPNLGVVRINNYDYTVADLPGLIKGAHTGAGLGHKFLKHIERTKVIAHIIDIAEVDSRDAYQDYLTIRDELAKYSSDLLKKKEIIIANKIDIAGAKDKLEILRNKISAPIYGISALTGEGLDDVVIALGEIVKSIPDNDNSTTSHSHVLYKYEEPIPYTITREKDVYVIKGDTVEKLFRRTNFNTEEAFLRFSSKLRKLGVEEDLIKQGIKEGDIVRILDYEFEWRN